MTTQVFTSFPVKDLRKSITFFKKLGYSQNPQFLDDTADCVVISETNYVMLLTYTKFQSFTPKSICDTSKSVEVSVTLTCESRERVDEMVAQAVGAGGAAEARPEDYGFMYQHGFNDSEGHHLGLVHMSAEPPQG